MKLLLIGYGKMGKAIEEIALQRRHTIADKISLENSLIETERKNIDVAIEFTAPEAVFENLKYCFEHQIPVVCGTTGWNHLKNEVEAMCKSNNGSLLFASNFSIGVNLFFKLNEHFAKLMRNFPDYNVSMEEVHHTEKKDAPSGTAISLANQIISSGNKQKWVNFESGEKNELSIISKRIAHVPGTHVVNYLSEIDSIELKHTAFNRKGFATGAVIAAEWLQGKTGVFGMNDLLEI